jgi:hypothetical protein
MIAVVHEGGRGMMICGGVFPVHEVWRRKEAMP